VRSLSFTLKSARPRFTVQPLSDCEEFDKLRAAYEASVDLWINAGGADPEKMDTPKAVAAKKHLDETAAKLVDHRRQHGC
jgi:hypothetical protein